MNEEKENEQLNDKSHSGNESQQSANEIDAENFNLENQNQNIDSNPTNSSAYSHIFGLSVSESISRKTSDPSITLLISIESDPNQEDSFWNDPSILSIISSGCIVVRLAQSKDIQEIEQFSSLFYVRSIPSLYLFGPYSQGVTYAWTNQYPTIPEFIQYITNQTPQSNFSEYQNQAQFSNHSINFINDYSIASDSTPNILSNEQQETTRHNSFSTTPQLRSINSSSSRTISSQASRRSTARISVQFHNEKTLFELPRDSKVSELLCKIENKYGTRYSYYVPHLRKCIGLTNDELNMTIATANLAPSSLIQIQEQGDPGYDESQLHPSLSDDYQPDEPYQPPPPQTGQFVSNAGVDAQPTLEIEESLPTLGHVDTNEVVPQLEIDEENPQNRNRNEQARCGWNWIINFLSIFNPWGDIEEVEDFFQIKEFR